MGQLRFTDLNGKKVAAAEQLFVGPWDIEIVRPELHVGRLLQLLRNQEVNKSRQNKVSEKAIEKNFWFPSRFAITDGRIRATNTITITNLSTTMVSNKKGVLIDPFGAICRIKRAGVNPPPLIIGPIRGMVEVSPDGCGELKLSGASAHFADEEASAIEVELVLCPDGRVEVNKVSGALPGGGRLSLSGSFSPLREHPLEGEFELIDIGADRIPINSSFIGNITSGVVALSGSYLGDPFLSPVDSQVKCTLSVKNPTFTIIQGSKETPLSLDELGARLDFQKRKLRLDNLVVAGFNGSVSGDVTGDFVNFPKISWHSQFNTNKLCLGELAKFFHIETIESGSLDSALFELDYDEEQGTKLFLRRGKLSLAKAGKHIVIPEISTRATINKTGKKVDFLYCRVGNEGVVKIKELTLPKDLDDPAKIILSCDKLDSSLLHHLGLVKEPPKGLLDCSIFFSGIVKKMHAATVKTNFHFAGEKLGPVEEAEGRFSIVDGKVTLAGARAKFLKGVGEAAGRGQFIEGEPTGRFTLAIRKVTLNENQPTLDATLSFDRREHTKPGQLGFDIKIPPPIALHLKGQGSLINLMSWENRLQGSTITIEPFTIERQEKVLTASAGATLLVTDNGYIIEAPSVSAFGRTVGLKGKIKRSEERLVIERLDVNSGKLKAALAGQLETSGFTMDVQALSEGSGSVGALLSTTLPVDWQKMKMKGRFSAKEYALDAIEATVLSEVDDLRLRELPKLSIIKGRAKLTLKKNVIKTNKIELDMSGGSIKLAGYAPMPKSKGNWSLKLYAHFEKSQQLIDCLWPRGPYIDGPLNLKLRAGGDERNHAINIEIEPLKVLLERANSGRRLSTGKLKVELKPRGDGNRYNFSLAGKEIMYGGPELHRDNGLSEMSLQGTWRKGLLSLTSSSLSFAEGGHLTLIGEVPLLAGVDGEFQYWLKDLNLAAWNPTYMVSLYKGRLSLAGSFLGAWGDIADSIVEFDLSLDKADIAAAGIKPGTFSLSSKVNYHKGSISMNEMKASLLGGTMEGRGQGRWDRKSRLIEFSTSFNGLDLGQWVKVNTPKGEVPPTVYGLMNGELQFKTRNELRAGFIGNGKLNIEGGQIKNVCTVVPDRGKKYLKRFRDLSFTKAKAKLFLIGDTLKMNDVELKSNCGQMDGWLRFTRLDGKVHGKLYSVLSKKLIPNRFAKSLASLFGGKYKNVGIVLDGPATMPDFDVILSPGSRKVFLGEQEN